MKKYSIGDMSTISKTITILDVQQFAEVTLDKNPVHLDESVAKNSIFKKIIAHGMLCGGLISAVLGNQLPGNGTIYLSQKLKFLKPVYLDDIITAQVIITKIDENRKIMTLETIVFNQNNKKVVDGEAVVIYPSGD